MLPSALQYEAMVARKLKDTHSNPVDFSKAPYISVEDKHSPYRCNFDWFSRLVGMP